MTTTIYEEYTEDRFYLKIDSEHDSSLFGAQLLSINLIEGFNFATPFLVINLLDAYGDSIHHTYISPSESYNVHLGFSLETAQTFKFKLGSLASENINGGKPDQIAIKAHFITEHWLEWMTKTYSRSWNDMFVSEIVEEIGNEIGFNVDVEQTRIARNIIQPNWTNYQLVKWLSKHALSSENKNSYQPLVTLDNRLSFKSLDTLYKQKPVKELIFGDGQFGEQNFKNLEFKQNYSDMLSQGSCGHKYMYFDYDNKQWVTGKNSVSTSNNRQLSDWYTISKNHDNQGKLFFNGRDVNTEIVSKNRITNISDSMLSLQVSIEGDINLRCGDVVNIIIPASEYSEKILNTVYSGYWMITKINHQITNQQNRLFVTHLSLVRQGMNGTNFTEFVKNTSGKNITNL